MKAKPILRAATLLARLIGPNSFGGWVRGSGQTLGEILQRLSGNLDVVERWTREPIDEYLAGFSGAKADDLRLRLDDFLAKRERLLPRLDTLCVEPLLAARAPATRQEILSYVESYDGLLRKIRDYLWTTLRAIRTRCR